MDMLGMTSRWVAAVRERESRRPDRLFNDPWAGLLAGDEGRALMAWMEAQMPLAVPGDLPFLTQRTRYFDDWIMAAAAADVRQFVILAAGMDTRAYRLPWPPGCCIYELDQPAVLSYKSALLQQAGAQPRAQRITAAVDLRGDFCAALPAAGYRKDAPSAWLIEGLLIYLPDEAQVRRLLGQAAAAMVSGSRLALDVGGTGLASLPVLDTIQARLRAGGAPWCFGHDDPCALLQSLGFAECSAVPSGQLGYRPGGQVLPARVSYQLLSARRD